MRSDAEPVEVGGGSAETDAAVAGSAAVEVGGVGAETDTGLADAAAVEVGARSMGAPARGRG